MQINQTNGKYRVKGINDDMDTCMHCGKSGLKKVVWLTSVDVDGSDMGEVFCVGVDCAKSLLKMKGSRDTVVYLLNEEYKRDIIRRIEKVKFAFFQSDACFLMRNDPESPYGISRNNGTTYIPRDIWVEYINSVRNGGELKTISDLVQVRNARYPICQEVYAEMGIKRLEVIAKELGV